VTQLVAELGEPFERDRKACPERSRRVFLSPDYKEEQRRPEFDPGRIRPILKADGGCMPRKTLTRVEFSGIPNDLLPRNPGILELVVQR